MQEKHPSFLVRALRTPNPLAIKFVANFPFKREGKASFTQVADCEEMPLFKELFGIQGVHQVYVFENQLTLSHQGDLTFEDIEKKAIEIIQNCGESHKSEFEVENISQEKKKKDLKSLPELHRKAEEILDRTIRPSLQADGGDVEIVSIEGNRINIMYEGACGGCPSALMGTLEAIENILRYELQNSDIEVYPM